MSLRIRVTSRVPCSTATMVNGTLEGSYATKYQKTLQNFTG
jgi:hypothetical protein